MEKYEELKAEICMFSADDVIVTSYVSDPDELPGAPIPERS